MIAAHSRRIALLLAAVSTATPAAAQAPDIDVAQLGDFVRWIGVSRRHGRSSGYQFFPGHGRHVVHTTVSSSGSSRGG